MFADPQQRTFAIGVWITSFSVGGAIGPLIGGVLLQSFRWGSVFLIAVPVMALLLLVGPRLLPEYRDPAAGRPDLPSAALSLGAVLAVIFGLKAMAQDGPGAVPIAVTAAGVGLGVLFTRRQRRLADPLIDLRLFRQPAFSASLATYGIAILLLFGGFLFLPQYLQLVRGLEPLQAGLWTLPWAVAFVLGSLTTPAISRRVKPHVLMAAGMALASIGFAAFARLDGTTSFLAFAMGSFAFSIGMAPVFTLTTDLIVGSAPPERAGAASALSETGAELGGALGIAVFGSLGVAVYRAGLGGAVPPSVPGQAAEAARATLGGALDVAKGLGAGGPALAGAAQEAFMDGLRLCAGVSAAGSLALAVFVATVLRRAHPAARGEAPLTPPAPPPPTASASS
jgi:DHA2 family multidrug resistance protein-like MFS transporter